MVCNSAKVDEDFQKSLIHALKSAQYDLNLNFDDSYTANIVHYLASKPRALTSRVCIAS